MSFFFALFYHSCGMPFSAETAFRSGEPPNMGQSLPAGRVVCCCPPARATAATARIPAIAAEYGMFFIRGYPHACAELPHHRLPDTALILNRPRAATGWKTHAAALDAQSHNP